jgi:hypothetical protein
MAAKEYVIKSLKKKNGVWKNSYGQYQDYALQLQGIGEPVKLSLPLPIVEDPEVGDRLYGRLYDESGDGGHRYHVLKLEKRPAEDLRQIDIHAQVGLKLAVEVYLNSEYEDDKARAAAYSNIATEALHFAKVIDEIKKELL